MKLSGTSILLFGLFVTCVLSAKAIGPTRARAHVVTGGGPMHPPVTGGGGAGARSSSYSKRSALQILSPFSIMAAYNITYSPTAGTGKIIAIVDAYGCSNCESDLATFNKVWGLPACNTSNGCFHKLNQTGGTTYPPDDATSNWGFEAAMDIQAAHAFAPGAKIYLIVAASDSLIDLFTAVQYAINTVKANVLSMSWGAVEWSTAPVLDQFFTNKTAYFASTGDYGSAGGIEYPSSSAKVIAIGGTSLYTNADYTLAAEKGWSGSGGGCSNYSNATAAQLARQNYPLMKCGGKKFLPDTSLVADPNSGMYTYFSGLYNGAVACTAPNCWWGGGGTSLATPITAARAAARNIYLTPGGVYTGGWTYRDITSGSNGAYNCTSGIDKVTGMGSLLK